MGITALRFAVAGLGIACAGSSRAGFTAGTEFAANDAVESVSVEIKVGEGGGDLAEPVALDLGLGFPFWLHPVGRADGERALWGAVPPSDGAGRKVRAGESASFLFQGGAEAGKDILRTSGQLLAGVRISDIARIGFASAGSNDWALAAYAIRINGKPFAANDGVAARAREKQDAARARLGELEPKIAPLQSEAEDLAALEEAGLATDQDKQRMRDVKEQISPLLRQKNLLRRQLDGIHPWFIEPDFHPQWRSGQEVGEVKVTLVTAAHTGAGTGNLVYFRTGGHKYLAASPANPLDPMAGPRVIVLDLAAGPLLASDLRGYGAGMIGSAQPFDIAPDRWHPQRLMVEVDGRVVYDSEENDIDRMSLEAIRVIPPAHFDATGKVVSNVPNARETFVWEAGKAMGVDLANGGALDLPSEGQPGYPEAEPGLAGGAPFGEEVVEDWGGFGGGYPPFPGEAGYGPGWDVVWEEDWGWGPGLGGGFGPSWLDVLAGVLDALAPLAPGIDPPPVGEPFQATAVRMTPPADPAGAFWVEWDVTGDAGSIQDFTVLILAVRPDRVDPIDFAAPLAQVDHVSAGNRSLAVNLSSFPAAADRPYVYLIPMVIGHATDAAVDAGVGDHSALGLALPYVFTATDPDQLGIVHAVDNTPAIFPLSAEDPGVPRAVWPAGEVVSHRVGLLFGSTMPGQNFVIRPGPAAPQDVIYLVLDNPALPAGRYRFVSNLGFEGESGGVNAADADAVGFINGIFLYPDAPPPGPGGIWNFDPGWPGAPQVITHAQSTPGGDQPMPVVEVQDGGAFRPIDTADVGGPGPFNFRIAIKIRGAAVDPAHPCVLFGLRLVRVP